MAEVSLLWLPMEIIYSIFDFIDFETILFSIRPVCKTLLNAVNQYNRLYISLNVKQENILKSLSCIIRPENVMGLSLITKPSTNMVKAFWSLFRDHQFTRLSSLSLHGIRDKDLEQILNSLHTSRLTSITIESSERDHNNIWKLISSVLLQANIQNLYAPNMDYKMENLSWPVQYGLRKLVFNKCTYTEYLVILNQLPSLQSLTMKDCIMKDTDDNPLTSSSMKLHTSLNSLTINDGSSSLNLELLIAPILELRHLKLISKYRKFDSMFEGYHWEQIIRTKLPHLKKLEFLLSCQNEREGNTYKIEPILATFKTPFWLIEKQWFICCSIMLSGSYIYLYTMPINIRHGKIVRCEVSSIDDTCRLTSRSFNAMVDHASTEMIGEIFLQHELIDWRGAQYLSIVLQRNSMITKLDLGQNSIRQRGAQYLSDALRENVTLTTLSLHDNKIEDDGTQFIADLLKHNKTLTSIDLGENKIEKIGIKYLNDALRQNTTLTILNLGNNQIGDEGAECLADILKINNTITELNIGANRINDKGAQHLADGLKNNTMLSKLCLGKNTIGKKGAQHLAEILLGNTTLNIIELGCNEIGNEGTKYLADVLQYNTTLTTLDLQVNNIDDKGAQSLIDALKYNKTIQIIMLYRNALSYKMQSNFEGKNGRIRY